MGSSSQASLAVTHEMSMHPAPLGPHHSVPEGLLGTKGVLAATLSQDSWRGGCGTGFVLPWYRESPGHAMALGLPRPQHDTHRR